MQQRVRLSTGTKTRNRKHFPPPPPSFSRRLRPGVFFVDREDRRVPSRASEQRGALGFHQFDRFTPRRVAFVLPRQVDPLGCSPCRFCSLVCRRIVRWKTDVDSDFLLPKLAPGASRSGDARDDHRAHVSNASSVPTIVARPFFSFASEGTRKKIARTRNKIRRDVYRSVSKWQTSRYWKCWSSKFCKSLCKIFPYNLTNRVIDNNKKLSATTLLCKKKLHDDLILKLRSLHILALKIVKTRTCIKIWKNSFREICHLLKIEYFSLERAFWNLLCDFIEPWT